MGKLLIILGVLLVIFGIAMVVGIKIPGVGKLPGDVLIKRDTMTFYFPLATSILFSILLTLLLNVISRR